ncbi:MAG: helix-turn-helix transcriptional regulator [Silicimonas sp.]|nr:helix-turn-helix transcriptional regulator [Silicimonas sp.]
MDKRDRALLFRHRLQTALQTAGVSRSALARTVKVDRSTVSQLLNPDTARLPNAQVVAECAAALGVSGDWLLGLSDFPERAADLLAGSLTVSEAPRAPVDQQIFEWLTEAAGYKVRHVPATLPDMLKTEELLRWEYAPHLGRTMEQAIGASRDHLNWMRQSMSDFEIAMPLFEVEAMITGTGYYRGLERDVRQRQVAHMLALHQELYPSLRVFLFDARRVWSAPVTTYGPLIAVLYLGQHYLSFRERDRVRTLIAHFDGLVREADVTARGWPDHIQALLASSF